MRESTNVSVKTISCESHNTYPPQRVVYTSVCASVVHFRAVVVILYIYVRTRFHEAELLPSLTYLSKYVGPFTNTGSGFISMYFLKTKVCRGSSCCASVGVTAQEAACPTGMVDDWVTTSYKGAKTLKLHFLATHFILLNFYYLW